MANKPRMKALQTAWNYMVGMLAILSLAASFGVFLKTIQPMSPVFTLIFVLVGTFMGMRKWTNATLTLSGIAMYILSWPAWWYWGWSQASALVLCGGGILMWIVGVMAPLPMSFRTSRTELPLG